MVHAHQAAFLSLYSEVGARHPHPLFPHTRLTLWLVSLKVPGYTGSDKTPASPEVAVVRMGIAVKRVGLWPRYSLRAAVPAFGSR